MIKINQPISVIIPAYNEEKNIGRVLDVVTKIKWIDEIIVVDDCSKDKTAAIAKKHKGVRVIELSENQGKGGALVTGIEAAKSELLLFLDADLTGLSESHLLEILTPILFTGRADLALGIFSLQKINETNVANRLFPGLSGQRAIWRRSLPDLDLIRKQRYGVDILITKSVPKKRRAIVDLKGLSQVTKEDKDNDLIRALRSRAKMYREVLKTMKEMKS